MFPFTDKQANIFKYELKYENGQIVLSPKEGAA
jgi:uncharacterized protein YegP (UPF0339 family)